MKNNNNNSNKKEKDRSILSAPLESFETNVDSNSSRLAATSLSMDLADTKAQLISLQNRNMLLEDYNSKLECRIQKISRAILERFDGDGIEDIRIPSKFNIFWIFSNIGQIVQMVREIVNILKDPDPCQSN